MRRFDVDRPSLDLDDCLRTLPRRISRTCRRPVRRARLGRRDLYYPHLLLVRAVFLSFRSHLPPPPPTPSPPYSSSLFLFNTKTTPTPTLHQSNLPHLTPSSPMSHRSSHLIYYTRYLYFPRSVLASFPYGRTHMLISSFSLSSLLSSPPICNTHPYGLPLAPMCWYVRWLTAGLSAPMVYFCAPAVPCILIRLHPTRTRT